MPRFLAMDWDPPKLNVLGVNVAKGRAAVEQSLAVPLADDLTPATAAMLGRGLKESLAAAGLAGAPVLFSLGRDKIILKELSIPFVPAHEEAAVVRFQTGKEMTEAASDVIFDYTLLSKPQAGLQTRVQVAIVRRSIVAAVTVLCQSAGLKLHALVPRPFALAGLLDRKTSTRSSMTRGVLVPAGAEEVELCIYSGTHLEWARSLATGPGLAGEVKRNLMLLAAQKTSLPDVERIEIAGLADLGDVGIPKETLNPWRDVDAKPANPTPFLAALGLAEIAAAGLTLNLAVPKEPKPVVDRHKQRMKMGMIAAAILVPMLILAWWMSLSKMQAQIRDLEVTREDLDETWKKLEQERLDVAALKDWEQTSISWLDELYDISARFPHAQGLRITQVSATQFRRRGAKDTFTGLVTIHGLMNSDQDTLVTQFSESLQQDKYLRVQSPAFKANEFTLKIDVAARPPLHYQTNLVVPPQPKKAPEPPPEPMPVPEEKKEAPSDE